MWLVGLCRRHRLRARLQWHEVDRHVLVQKPRPPEAVDDLSALMESGQSLSCVRIVMVAGAAHKLIPPSQMAIHGRLSVYKTP